MTASNVKCRCTYTCILCQGPNINHGYMYTYSCIKDESQTHHHSRVSEDEYMCTYLSVGVLTLVFEMSHRTHIIHWYQRVKNHSTTGVTCHGS